MYHIWNTSACQLRASGVKVAKVVARWIHTWVSEKVGTGGDLPCASVHRQSSSWQWGKNYDTICLHLGKFNTKSHWVWRGDDSKYPDHIGVFELSHDGCLLQELHPLVFCQTPLQRLHRYLHSRTIPVCDWAPHTTVYCPKLATAKVLMKSAIWEGTYI